MKIAAALTGMDAAQTYTEVNSFTLGLTAEQQQASPLQNDQFTTRFRSLINTASLQPVTKPGRKLQSPAVGAAMGDNNRNPLPGHELFKRLTGEIIGSPVRIRGTYSGEQLSSPEPTQLSLPMQATVTSRLIHYEREELYFSSSGRVATEDGREISFSLDLSMQRSSVETLELSISKNGLDQYLLDPLILSFTGGPPVFSNTSFLFDLDCDGREDEIAGLQPGCGFLAFDVNGDGTINNGLELFGPRSGNGFSDLSIFDTDDNLWIDENDPIFESLSVWRRNEQGEDSLQTLREAGVGAISLSHAGTRFTLQGSDNTVLGQVTANSIFLTENGEVCSLQEVDLAVGGPGEQGKKDQLSNLETLHEAMFSLRILIAMQQMRARLKIARKQLEEFFLQTRLAVDPLHPLPFPAAGTEIKEQDGPTAAQEAPGHGIVAQPVDAIRLPTPRPDLFPSQHPEIMPILSPDMIQVPHWPSLVLRKWKNPLFHGL